MRIKWKVTKKKRKKWVTQIEINEWSKKTNKHEGNEDTQQQTIRVKIYERDWRRERKRGK